MNGRRRTRIRTILLVLSGKGGVGKSTTTTCLSLALPHLLRPATATEPRADAPVGGARIGILDVDLTGPSMPRMLSVQASQVHQGSNGWVPVRVDLGTTGEDGAEGGAASLRMMSLAFLLKGKDDPVVWRGPKKNAMIKQFLEDVDWGELDYLVVDTPPGTGDEHISLAEMVGGLADNVGAVVVTTPQAIAINDVRKELNFCEKVGIPVWGIIENMSGYVCPTCEECYNLFSKGGGEVLARDHKLPFLGSVPIDPNLVRMIETSEGGIGKHFSESPLFEIFKGIAEKLVVSAKGGDVAIGDAVKSAATTTNGHGVNGDGPAAVYGASS
ncbi:cytosolic Fe-S cluster assembly factor cfd1 [Irineochytrium annulatum]|nr:cytosolic Fe-S cluster assembly factor cfd1 [Irineochytrium annulatum]